MKVALNQRVFTVNQYKPKYQNIAFCGKTTTDLPGDSLEKLNSEKVLFENILMEFSDKINLEKHGDKTKMPNCIMFETKNEGSEILPIEWLKKTADCNFVHLADKNNDDLADDLWNELKKSRDNFQQTKRRTIIQTDGFDRLITSGQNSFENIDSIKDIMVRTANDFGATIVFSTKDSSKLISETIQPQRVTKFTINSSKVDLEKYNTFLDSNGYFKDYEKRIVSKVEDVPKIEIQKNTTEVKTEIPIKQIEQSKRQKSNSDAPPFKKSSEINVGVTTTNSSIEAKNETKAKSPKTLDTSHSIKTTGKSSAGSRTFKVVAVLVAIGATIAGFVYFMKNKNNNLSRKK